MKEIFQPRNIAIFGVSGQHPTMAANIFENLARWDYRGGVFLIHPQGGDYDGYAIHKSLRKIEDPVDLAVVLTRASRTPGIMKACAEKGVKAVCILSGGFGELGGEGLVLSRSVKQIAADNGIDVVGPNCLGVINTENGLCTPFIPFKANRTEAGNRSARSHTAALRDDHETFLAGMKQAGVAVSDNFNGMGTTAKAFLLPRMKGKRIGVVSGAGGQIVMAADCAEENNFTLPEPGGEVIETVTPNIRSGVIRLSNPIDLGDTLGSFVLADAAEAFMKQPDMDGTVVLSIKRSDRPFDNETWAGFNAWVYDRYEPLAKRYGKPLIHCVSTSLDVLRELQKTFSYPVFDNLGEAFRRGLSDPEADGGIPWPKILCAGSRRRETESQVKERHGSCGLF